MAMPADAADKVDGSIFSFQDANRFKNHFYTDDSLSAPPTDAELDALFTSPASIPPGCVIVLKNLDSSGLMYLITSDGTNWWIFTGAMAS